jgi:hypothetical protein
MISNHKTQLKKNLRKKDKRMAEEAEGIIIIPPIPKNHLPVIL